MDRAGWRPLLVASGVLSIVGGAMHPSAPTDLSFNDNLAVMMEKDAWVPSHLLLAVGSALLVAGLVAVRRNGAWPVARRLLLFAVGAAALNVVEMLVHTVAFVDREELAADEAAPVAFTHLGLATIAYPLVGIAIVLLALRFAQVSSVLRVIAVIGVIGGAANALAVPLAVITQGNDFDVLFPIGAVGIAAWLMAIGVIGLGSTRATAAT